MKYIVITMLCLVLSPCYAYAQTNSCEKLLRSCDSAVNYLENTVGNQEDVIQKQQELLTNQLNQINRLKDKAWYENKWLWFGAGFVVGGYFAHEIQE